MVCLFVRSSSALLVFTTCFSSARSAFCHPASSSFFCSILATCASLASLSNFLVISIWSGTSSTLFILSFLFVRAHAILQCIIIYLTILSASPHCPIHKLLINQKLPIFDKYTQHKCS